MYNLFCPRPLPCSVDEPLMPEVRALRRERWLPMRGDDSTPRPAPVPVWLQPVSTFGWFGLTTFITRSLVLTVASTLAPLQLVLPDPSCPHGFDASRLTVGYSVRRLPTGRSLTAVLRRVRLMGQPVLSERHTVAAQFHRRLHVAQTGSH